MLSSRAFRPFIPTITNNLQESFNVIFQLSRIKLGESEDEDDEEEVENGDDYKEIVYTWTLLFYPLRSVLSLYFKEKEKKRAREK